jgi:hypothetical protein
MEQGRKGVCETTHGSNLPQYPFARLGTANKDSRLDMIHNSMLKL